MRPVVNSVEYFAIVEGRGGGGRLFEGLGREEVDDKREDVSRARHSSQRATS